MKRFKTKRSIHIEWIIFIIIFFIFFILISLCKLDNNHKVINYLLRDFGNYNKTHYLSSNLDLLFSSYAFKEEKNIYHKKKTVYLYNTHDNEKYHDNTNISDVTIMLSNNLNKLGIKTVIEKEKCSDYTNTGLSYYDISREFIKNNLENKFDYYIDIHRDSVSNTKISINNKPYAKILFVLGIDNENYLENKKVLERMNNYLNNEYPGISRGIYEKDKKSGNGIYNQDLGSNVLLIEVGGVDNNYEELYNSTEIISLMIYHMLGE